MNGGVRVGVLFYVQHLLGLGHLMRASRIAEALQENGFQVTLVTGGVTEPDFQLPGVEHVALPSIAVQGSDFSVLVDRENNPIDSGFKAMRCQQLLDVYARTSPTVVIIEAFPFGRRQMRFELIPLIKMIEAGSPKPWLLSSVRDTVQRRTKPGRDAETAELIKQHFDKVLVHGDPQVAALADSFSHTAEIADQIVYTGLVFGSIPPIEVEPFEVVVSVGGGAVGFELLRTVLEASNGLPAIESWCVVTGPNMPQWQVDQLIAMAPKHVIVRRFRTDFIALLAKAKLSISQAGYNTVNDIVQAGCRAVLIPYSGHGETEQSDRAARMGTQGRATIIDESELSAPLLVSVITEAMKQDPPAQPAESLNGARQTAMILKEMISLESQ